MTDCFEPETLARAEAMKERLRGCTSIAAVNAAVKEIAGDVAALAAQNAGLAAQVKNLAGYRRMCIDRGWK